MPLLVLSLDFLVGLELLLVLALAAAEASVGGPPTSDARASDAARAPSAVFGGMATAAVTSTYSAVQLLSSWHVTAPARAGPTGRGGLSIASTMHSATGNVSQN